MFLICKRRVLLTNYLLCCFVFFFLKISQGVLITKNGTFCIMQEEATSFDRYIYIYIYIYMYIYIYTKVSLTRAA